MAAPRRWPRGSPDALLNGGARRGPAKEVPLKTPGTDHPYKKPKTEGLQGNLLKRFPRPFHRTLGLRSGCPLRLPHCAPTRGPRRARLDSAPPQSALGLPASGSAVHCVRGLPPLRGSASSRSVGRENIADAMNEVNSESNYLCRRYVHGRKKSPRAAGVVGAFTCLNMLVPRPLLQRRWRKKQPW